ncbi:hypothetical protein AWJ20_5222 [Sugiyamaella lignohabitans]|uniref:Mitochondrial resolvase Ydc2 catalytic domain-containing protein n=1 Tax=Sugiyamaella lignohabitans TaxID=796027 RepID=A0A161HFG0_9ASCO|nr:uncharacterized protein AWJ20_5222 [Sugiyamaella lignohabitans]ANB14260.1 hypothetical protein AWJ20_5222 [Sugiyamaella lignohabitans]
MGLKNVALCQLSVPLPDIQIESRTHEESILKPRELPTVNKWSVFELNGWNTPKAFEQPHFASMAIELIKKLHDSVGMDVVLIEQQRMRSGGSRSVPEVIAQINVLEGMLHALLANDRTCFTESVSPAKVTSYWVGDDAQPTVKKLSPSQRYARTKKAKVAVVDKWLDHISTTTGSDATDVPVQFADNVISDFHNQATRLKKRDDLCDSLLQAVAWTHWQTNRALVHRNLHSNLDVHNLLR